MKPKILIADDSLTIQKVIKITLANEDYDLIECIDEKDLIESVNSHRPSLVLLDFNLSENKTGYDLSKEIKAVCQSKIMMLFGTFDTIDEDLLQASGVNDHIVKPFDGNKFINSCRQLISDSSLEETSSDIIDDFEEDTAEFQTDDLLEEAEDFPGPIEDNTEEDFEEIEVFEEFEEIPSPIAATVDDDIEEWVVDQPDIIDESPEDKELEISTQEMNQLEAGMKDWGMEIPEIISEDVQDSTVASNIELPPIIGDDIENSFQEINPAKDIEDESLTPTEGSVNAISETEELILPDSSDLEYPDFSAADLEIETTPTSQLISTEEFHDDDNSIALDDVSGTNTDEEVKELEAQIADELEEDISVEDSPIIDEEEQEEENLWAADEFEDEASLPVQEQIEEVKKDLDVISKVVELEEDPLEIAAKEFAPDEDADDVEIPEKISSVEETATAINTEPQFSFTEKELEQKLEKMVAPLVEKLVKEQIEKTIEQVSWEVIPDLAENLIKKELRSISEQIL